MSDNLIEFNNISKFFGSVIALKDVTMHIKKGQIMCLLGDNGAGKSTVSTICKHLGFKVYNSDQRAKEIVSEDSIIKKKLIVL